MKPGVASLEIMAMGNMIACNQMNALRTHGTDIGNGSDQQLVSFMSAAVHSLLVKDYSVG